MSWRTVQLNDNLCDQDLLILDLFKNKSVRYIGKDTEFSQHLTVSEDAKNVVAIFNQPGWLSDLLAFINDIVNTTELEDFYVGINRYCLYGNDTDIAFPENSTSRDLIDLLTKKFNSYGFVVTKFGVNDQDQGKYFNFVQPITWIYGTNKNK